MIWTSAITGPMPNEQQKLSLAKLDFLKFQYSKSTKTLLFRPTYECTETSDGFSALYRNTDNLKSCK